MQNSSSESSEIVSPEVSNGHYTVIVTDSTDSTHPDEFVLDLSALPCESDYTFDTSSNNFYDLDTFPKGTKRRFEIDDVSEVNIADETRSSGYDSDTEHGEEDMALERKRKKVRCNKYKAQRSPSKYLASGEKRKYSEEEIGHQRKKRLKTSLAGEYDKLSSTDSSTSSCSDSSFSSSDSSSSNPDSSSESSSSSSDSDSSSYSCSCTDSSSDSSSSDNDTLHEEMPFKYLNAIQRILPCAESCACKAGQSRPPIPIERSSRVTQPLYKKLLQRRLLSMANTFSNTCCNRQCYLDWTRKRISLGRMVRDYGESDLRVDYFSWGQWKQTPDVDEENSSEEEWFW